MFGWRRKPERSQPATTPDVPRPVSGSGADGRDVSRASPPGSGWLPRADRDRAALLDDGIEGGRRLDYPEAAEAFIAWLQANHETGEISRPRLEMLYAHHCAEAGLAMVPSNYLFQALAREAKRFERSVPRRDRKRQRVTTYDIPRQCLTPSGSAGGHGLPAGARSGAHDGEQDHVASATQRRAA